MEKMRQTPVVVRLLLTFLFALLFVGVMVGVVGSANWVLQQPVVASLNQDVESTQAPATEEPAFAATYTPMAGSTGKLDKVSPVDGMELVYIPAGSFQMGSENGAKDETPVHTIYLDEYWIDRTEVTNAMYRQCVEDGACTKPASVKSYNRNALANYPVVQVNWHQAVTYCEWAGRRLPTEAEWEKAARGTDSRTYPWGGTIDCTLANYRDCEGKTTVAGNYPQGSSPYGVLDMAGNVWEWTADWYQERYYSQSPKNNPLGPDAGEDRVLRGGSWDDEDKYLRTTFRFTENPDGSSDFDGFRCATSIAQDEAEAE